MTKRRPLLGFNYMASKKPKHHRIKKYDFKGVSNYEYLLKKPPFKVLSQPESPTNVSKSKESKKRCHGHRSKEKRGKEAIREQDDSLLTATGISLSQSHRNLLENQSTMLAETRHMQQSFQPKRIPRFENHLEKKDSIIIIADGQKDLSDGVGEQATSPIND